MKKVKNIILILILIVGTTLVVGCTEKEKDKSVENTNVEELQDESKDESITIKEEETEENEVDYKTLYNEEITKLIAKYGKFDAGSSEMIRGIKYGELLDFDKDKIPEMIILNDRQVMLYTIKDGQAKCIYEGTIGSRYAQSDVSYYLGINDNSDNTSLIVYHSEKSWEEEKISIVTVENGEVNIKELYAKTMVGNGVPIRENLIEFFIDNQSVTADEYNNTYNSVVQDVKKIDACFDVEPSSKNNLELFIQSLQ